MADDTQINSGGDSQTAGNQNPPSDTTPGGEGSVGWWDEAQKRGFKSQDDVWKSYRESERKITEQAETLKQAERFEKEVAPLINVIWSDDALLNQVRNKLQGTETPNDKPAPKDVKKDDNSNSFPAPSYVDKETRSVLSRQIVADFEKENGIDKLDDDSRDEVRKIIGNTMGRWIEPGKAPSLNQLRPLLDDAITVAREKDKKLNSILKDIPQASDDGASIPSQSSSTGMSGDNIRLTPEQEAVARKMPGGVDAYVKGLKSLMGK